MHGRVDKMLGKMMKGQNNNKQQTTIHTNQQSQPEDKVKELWRSLAGYECLTILLHRLSGSFSCCHHPSSVYAVFHSLLKTLTFSLQNHPRNRYYFWEQCQMSFQDTKSHTMWEILAERIQQTGIMETEWDEKVIQSLMSLATEQLYDENQLLSDSNLTTSATAHNSTVLDQSSWVIYSPPLPSDTSNMPFPPILYNPSAVLTILALAPSLKLELQIATIHSVSWLIEYSIVFGSQQILAALTEIGAIGAICNLYGKYLLNNTTLPNSPTDEEMFAGNVNIDQQLCSSITKIVVSLARYRSTVAEIKTVIDLFQGEDFSTTPSTSANTSVSRPLSAFFLSLLLPLPVSSVIPSIDFLPSPPTFTCFLDIPTIGKSSQGSWSIVTQLTIQRWPNNKQEHIIKPDHTITSTPTISYASLQHRTNLPTSPSFLSIPLLTLQTSSHHIASVWFDEHHHLLVSLGGNDMLDRTVVIFERFTFDTARPYHIAITHDRLRNQKQRALLTLYVNGHEVQHLRLQYDILGGRDVVLDMHATIGSSTLTPTHPSANWKCQIFQLYNTSLLTSDVRKLWEQQIQGKNDSKGQTNTQQGKGTVRKVIVELNYLLYFVC